MGVKRKVLGPRVDHDAVIPQLIADWRTGKYKQSELSIKYQVSRPFVHKHVSHLEQDTAQLISNIIQTKQELSSLDEFSMNSVNKVVDEKIRDLAFYNHSQNKLASIAMRALDAKLEESGLAGLSTNDIDGLSRVVDRSRNGVIGKPETGMNVQINTGAEAPASINFIGMG